MPEPCTQNHLPSRANRGSRIRRLVWGILLGLLPACASAQQLPFTFSSSNPGDGGAYPSSAEPASAASLLASGRIDGIVKSISGDTIAGAVVTLTSGHHYQTLQATSEGAFVFEEVAPGPFQVDVSIDGFEPWTTSGTVQRGQSLRLSNVALMLSTVSSAVEVSASSHDVASAQLQFEEKQRVLGVFPNYYASYIWDAEPLTPRQKFSLAWRFSMDPVALATTGMVAGIEQSRDGFSGYGRGAPGYMRRFGATYGNGLSSTVIGQALLPSLLHQDPRYFVKGTGTVRARALYALSTIVICRGDNRKWQVNYSNILGNVASAGLSNLYYPASSRQGVGLTVQNSLVATALGAVADTIQEFLLHRMTPDLPDYGAALHP